MTAFVEGGSTMRTVRLLAICAWIVLTLPLGSAIAQPVSRLKGRVITDAGTATDGVEVQALAMAGFGGGGYVGPPSLSARSNAKGEWTIVGLRAGVWMIDVSVAQGLPEAVAVPVNLFVPQSPGSSGLMLTWQLVMKLAPVPDGDAGRILHDAAQAARAGDAERVRSLLTRVPQDADIAFLTAAGGICLIARDPALARALFRAAASKDPMSYRAARGLASAALVQQDFAEASRQFALARDRTKDKDEQRYLSAAIGDLAQQK
jgi:hypothetical protein